MCVSSAAMVTRAGIGCKRHQFIQNGPEHRVVTRRCRIQSLRNPAAGSNNEYLKCELLCVLHMANSRGPSEFRHGDVSETGP